jgi:hypothetical protein
MDSLAYYAILGSLIAGAAGTLILLTVAVRQGVWGRGTVGTELAPADRARRHRTIRLADTSALLCFAASAALAIFGVMQQASLATVADAPRDRAEIIARFEAVETRVGLVEAQRQADASAALTAGDRLARLERRIDAGEARVTPAAPRVPKTRVGYATMPAYAVPEPLTRVPPHRRLRRLRSITRACHARLIHRPPAPRSWRRPSRSPCPLR